MLLNKTVLITGAAKRIGKEIALAIAKKKYNIISHYNTSKKEANVLSKKLKKFGIQSWSIKADLSDIKQTKNLIADAKEIAGSIDIIINCASIFDFSNILNTGYYEILNNINVNALSPLIISREFSKTSKNGSIINFLDTKITQYDNKHGSYHLSKLMLFNITRILALELAPGIKVNAIAPGLILPPAGKDTSYLENNKHNNPLNRFGTLSDITEAVLFLLNSEFITGQVLFIDGGEHMKGSVYGL